jgi:N-acetylmuramoyl-L-alanine amidase
VEILEKTTVAGAVWGRTDRGWICLSFVKLDGAGQPTEPENTEPETTAPPENEDELLQPVSPKGTPATVISKTGLNIRSGAGTGYPRVGSYASGSRIRILEQKNVSGVAWGRTDKGWVCMQYVRLEENRAEEAGIRGRVISSTGLNIRSGPGVVHPPVGSYAAGETVLILEQTVASGRKWGRTDKGWVCMDYVRLEDSAVDSGSGETQAPTVPETTAPETTPPQVTEPEQKPAQVTGTVTASALNVRASAGTGAKVVGSYRRGDKVVILEQTMVNGTLWGRTNKGWISLAYVELDAQDVPPDGVRTGVITASVLCIRKGPGTGNVILGTYNRGETVTILETAKSGNVLWGRTDKGWICMDYVK